MGWKLPVVLVLGWLIIVKIKMNMGILDSVIPIIFLKQPSFDLYSLQ